MHQKIGALINKILHILEFAIAVMTLVVLVIMLGIEIRRMLVDLTPANTLEVLIVAIARQVILSHDDPWSNVASILCIAGLFATRRYLIAKKALKMELSQVE